MLGLSYAPVSAVRGGNAHENAEIVHSVLSGNRGPHFDTVVFNAGIGLFTNGQVPTIREGVEEAKDSILSGRALKKLEAVKALSENTVQIGGGEMTILDEILRVKRSEVSHLLAEQVQFPANETTRPSLFETLRQTDHLQVIAEIKRASPSKGLIAEGADPVKQAITYYKSGAACISVLTDTTFFKGSFDDLAAVANAVPIPLLCKDFIVHKVQIDRAKSAGASVVLLIVAALNR